MDKKLSSPLSTLQWVDRDMVKPNDYNPNKVSKQNLELLKQSILTNGWTLPIVVRPDFTIIDGFHRWTVAGEEPLKSMLEGKVPVVIVEHKDKAGNIYGTVTHNRAILGTLSGANNKLLMCGNPTRTSGTFYDAFNVDRSIYRCHTVSSADSKRTNKQNIESLIRKYGKDSNVVLVRVFGEFPKQEDDVFIALSIVEHCCMLDLPDDVPIKRISFGVDVARYGSDETVIAKNVGGRITLPVSFRGQSLMTTVGKIVQLYRQAITEFPRYRGKIYINIDDCGLGGGVTDRLEEVKQEEKLTRMVIVPVNAAGKVPEETLGDGKQKACDIYDNMTTYLWGTVKDALMMEEVSLENDNELVAQFTCRKYRLTSRGKMLLESKEEMKKRGIDSPDRADAVALSCYQKKTFNIGSLVD